MPFKMYKETAPSFKSVVAVAAGKGGVGKSTIAVNISLALSALGYKTGLLDADLYGPSLQKMIPEDREAKAVDGKISPAESGRLKLMSMAFFLAKNSSSSLRAPQANLLIDTFINKTLWGDLDYLIIDFPPGTGDIPMTLCQKIPLSGVVLATTPQEISLLDVRKAAAMFKSMNIPLIGVVENMSWMEIEGKKHYPFGKGGGSVLSQELKSPLLAEIPLNPLMADLMDKGFNIFESHDPEIKKQSEYFTFIAKNLSALSQFLKISSFFASDKFSFVVEWSDGMKQRIKLAELLNDCPCAACKSNRPGYRKEAEAKGIIPVGQYAVKIDFIDGCQKGIFTYDHLRRLGEIYEGAPLNT